MDFVTTFTLILIYLSIGVLIEMAFNKSDEFSPTVMIFWPLVIVITTVIIVGALIYALIKVFKHRK